MTTREQELETALREAVEILDGDGEYPATARRLRAVLAGGKQTREKPLDRAPICQKCGEPMDIIDGCACTGFPLAR